MATPATTTMPPTTTTSFLDDHPPEVPEDAGGPAPHHLLIPGLPNEIAEHCLLHLPFPDAAVARSVSSAWKRAVTDPSFQSARRALSIPRPHLFVFAFHRSTTRLQWLAFDTLHRSWFALPSMPPPQQQVTADSRGSGNNTDPDAPSPVLCPSAFATAAVPERGELYVLGGMRADNHAPLRSVVCYSAATNSWRTCAPMRSPRSYFAAGAIGGRIVVSGGTGSTLGGGAIHHSHNQHPQQQQLYSDDEEASGSSMLSSSEVYDPSTDRWTPLPRMRCGMSRYDAAVVGNKLYVTEGWTWPFSLPPRGAAYDAQGNVWEDMRVGMREGWTGSAVVLAGRMFVVSECGDCRVKVYDDNKDVWNQVAGKGVPPELRKPFAVSASEEEEDGGSAGRRMRRRIYVVAAGMGLAIGELEEEQQQLPEEARAAGRQRQQEGQGGGRWRVEWEVVKGPLAFVEMSPSYSHVIYA